MKKINIAVKRPVITPDASLTLKTVGEERTMMHTCFSVPPFVRPWILEF